MESSHTTRPNHALQRTAGASRLQSLPPVRWVAELGSLGAAMPTYIVHRRRGPPFEIVACAYTEVKRAKRIYFHKHEDKTDRDCFCFLSEVAAIDKRDEAESLQQLIVRAKNSPEMMRALEQFRATGELRAPTQQEEWEATLAQLPSESDMKST
jgi:hypothetical protein